MPGGAAVSPLHPTHVHVGAQSFDPALLAHEIGHFFGTEQANLDSPNGPREYDDRFCLMGRKGPKASFAHPALNRWRAVLDQVLQWPVRGQVHRVVGVPGRNRLIGVASVTSCDAIGAPPSSPWNSASCHCLLNLIPGTVPTAPSGRYTAGR